MSTESTDLDQLRDASSGDHLALELVLERYRPRLRRLVSIRLDRRVQARVDASDVIQEAYIEAAGRLGDYLSDPPMAFFLWLRFLVCQKIIQLHRHHLNIQARDVTRELSIDGAAAPAANSESLAGQLMGNLTSPSVAVMRNELRSQLHAALDELDPIDREILALRHFEHLTITECAQTLSINLTTACNRYVRAIKRIKQRLPAELDELWQ